ncbi:MAG: hypothetical protein R2830_04600 [Saprospiraceae bacterium]
MLVQETISHKTLQELEAGLHEILAAPKQKGELAMIVRRPEKLEREELQEGELNEALGLVGDNWLARSSEGSPNARPETDTQLTLMNTRAVQLMAGERVRWKLAGDQLYVDLDLSKENLPPGTRLSVGSAVLEVTAVPHTGCKKFVERFGMDAMKFVNSPTAKDLRLRGMYAKVVKPGTLKVGDIIEKIN